MSWTDAHCHLDTAEQVADAVAAGVTRLITVGVTAETSQQALGFARNHPGTVWATAGVHPHDAKDGGLDVVESLLGEPGVVAVGECGLDYHYDHSPRDTQREVFAAQIAMANRHGTALVIHTREAWDDTFDVLDAEGVPERMVFHCFTGGPDEARRCLDRGALLSFSGIVTFPSAGDVREAAALCPLDRLTVETDSPYLAPVPHRGKRNQPAWVADVGAGVAAAKGVAVEEVRAASWTAAERLFRLV